MANRPIKVRDEFTHYSFYDAPGWQASQKAELCEALARFVESEFSRERFTKKLYQLLHLYVFGHTAEYDIDGFYDAWFSSTERRVAWIERLLTYNRSTHISEWRDFERCFARWLETSGQHEHIKQVAERDVERRERAELARLLAKYPDVRQEIYEEIA